MNKLEREILKSIWDFQKERINDAEYKETKKLSSKCYVEFGTCDIEVIKLIGGIEWGHKIITNWKGLSFSEFIKIFNKQPWEMELEGTIGQEEITMKQKIKTWYTCKLPSGEITALTLDECKREADRYLRGEYFGFYDNNYIMVTDKVLIYKHTHKGEIILECERRYCENDERGEEQVGIDYGVLGFMTEWKV